jgi:hypothetical protein
MKTTGEYIIYRSDTDEFLATRLERKHENILGWCSHPAEARRYSTFERVEAVAREMVGNLGTTLTICELYESESAYEPRSLIDIFVVTGAQSN